MFVITENIMKRPVWRSRSSVCSSSLCVS